MDINLGTFIMVLGVLCTLHRDYVLAGAVLTVEGFIISIVGALHHVQ